MATVHLTYFHAVPSAKYHGQPPLPLGNSAIYEAYDTEATDGPAVVVEGIINCVRVYSDSDLFVAIGETPDTAAASDGTRQAHYYVAGSPMEFIILTGETLAIEAVA